MKEIPLTQGFVALVDDEDYEALSVHKWHTMKGRYGVRRLRDGGSNPYLYMHRVILNAPSGMEVDHISGDGLDNRRSNLRLATHAQNLKNQRRQKTNKSGYKGVCWHRKGRRWVAQIQTNGLRKYLGLFDSPAEAHAAYCIAAEELHGEFARFSFPDLRDDLQVSEVA